MDSNDRRAQARIERARQDGRNQRRDAEVRAQARLSQWREGSRAQDRYEETRVVARRQDNRDCRIS